LEGLYRVARFKAGLSIIYEKNTVEEAEGDFFEGSPGPYPERETNTTTILLDGYYTFIQKKNSSFYTGVAIGPAFSNRKDYIEQTTTNACKLGYQLTAVGFEYHHKIGFFIEAGYGYKGILCGGITLTIPHR
jgi:hypothetical protein